MSNHRGIEIVEVEPMGRAEQLRGMSPQLVADVTLDPAYDGWPLLGDTAIEPGEQRRIGFVFLSGEEAASIMRKAGTFYLWEGRFIGEAKVVQSQDK